MKIAFQTFTRPVWIAGMVTFRDLLVALHTLQTDRPNLELVQWENSEARDYEPLMPYIDTVHSIPFPLPQPPPPPRRPPTTIEVSDALSARLRRNLARKLLPPPLPLPPPPRGKSLRERGVDCSFSVLIEERVDLSVPLLVWIYDLQHHHLPDLLSPRERRKRDAVIAREAALATRLVVKSSSIAQDLRSFLPQAQDKIRILQWVADVPPTVYDREPIHSLARYHLPDKFFYLPNQFWSHKNHALVVKALDLLRKRSVHPVVVCTGATYDDRNPETLASLLTNVSQYNLRDQFVLLGTVPREDVFSLMRQSVAVLNPSLFEGFGLSAAEAKSLGKRTLLADLPALREQDPPQSMFFDGADAQDLADKLELLWRTVEAGPDLTLEREAREALPARQREFARTFLQVASEAVSQFHAPKAELHPNV